LEATAFFAAAVVEGFFATVFFGILRNTLRRHPSKAEPSKPPRPAASKHRTKRIHPAKVYFNCRTSKT
jgi:hypothetical protein